MKRSTDPAPGRGRRRTAAASLLPLLLSLLLILAFLFLLTGLFPTPDGLLAELARRPELQTASPARILLEGMALWYRAFLLFLAVILALAALILLWALWTFLRHHRWCKAHREAYRKALAFSRLVRECPDFAVDDPYSYNTKSGSDPTPAWWYEVWEKKERADALIREYELHSRRRISAFLSPIPLLLVCALMAFVVFSEEVPSLYERTRSDIAQLEAGQCETVTVWLSPKVRQWHIDGPYTASQPALLTRYGAVSDDTDGKWVNLFVPWGLDFSLDPDRLYDENRSIQWNAQYAQMYKVRYTSGHRLILDIRPADTPPVYLS